MAKDVRRPILITLLAVLYILGGVILLLLAGAMFVLGTSDVSTIFSGETLDNILKMLSDLGMTWSQFSVFAGAALLVAALINILIGWGFLKGWALFWYLGVIFNILAIAATIYGYVTASFSGGIGGAVFSFLLLLYLFLPGVRRFFLTKSS